MPRMPVTTTTSNSGILDAGRPRVMRRIAKRTLDVLLAGAGILASAPLWLAIAAAIKLDSRGPVFYGQPRVGERGRIFGVLKFRSMIADADRDVGPMPAAERDARVTRVGRVLRASAMDELPQLWNIFRGDMSFVGPRALRPEEIDVDTAGRAVALDEVPGFAARSAVPPGLTGVAQIYARRDVSRRQKFRFDRLYIRKQSTSLDVRLILLSFWITARGSWEARGRKF
jgi:lipopolysaccharide/colanic/teichoic acid biosynthesis glycosyltransferase